MDNDELLEQIENNLTQWVEENYPDGEDLYADASDELSDDEVNEILAAPYPEDALNDKCMEYYDGMASDMEDEAFNDAKDYLTEQSDDPDAFRAFWDENEDELRDVFRETYYVNYPVDNFRNQELFCDVLLDDINHGISPYVNADFGDAKLVKEALAAEQNGTDISQNRELLAMKQSGLAYLAETQGYSYEEFLTFLSHATDANTYEQEGFLPSVMQEITNLNNYPGALTFLKRYTLGELMELQQAQKEHKEYELILNREDSCGIYDGYNGAGGPFEITLEEPLRLPLSRVAAIVTDHDNPLFSYSIDDTYGMVSSVWTEGTFLSDTIAKRDPKVPVLPKHAVLYSQEPYLGYDKEKQTTQYLGYVPVTKEDVPISKNTSLDLIPEHTLRAHMAESPSLTRETLNNALTDDRIQSMLTRQDIPYLTEQNLRETVHSAVLQLWSHELATEKGAQLAPIVATNLLDAKETVLYQKLWDELHERAHDGIAFSQLAQRSTAGMEAQKNAMAKVLQEPLAERSFAPEHKGLAEILLHGDSVDVSEAIRTYYEHPIPARRELMKRGQRLMQREMNVKGIDATVTATLRGLVTTLKEKGYEASDIYRSLHQGVKTVTQTQKNER